MFVERVFAEKSSYDRDPSLLVAATERVLVPGSQSDDSSSSTYILDTLATVSEDPMVNA